MDLLKIGAQLFMNKIGSSGNNLDLSSVVSALSNLMPTKGGELDLPALIGQMQSGGLASIAASFLSSGDNGSFGVSDVMKLFGESKVEQFSNELDIDKTTAASGLSDMIPELIDKNSESGSLLSSVGGAMAKSMLGKLF